MRHVFPTSEISHKWAHQTQEDARNPQGNLYFRGATLYSYRDSYPIARIFKKKNAQLILHVSETYSVTTSGHCSGARHASSHLPSITVPVCIADRACEHAVNLKYLQDEQLRLHAEAGRVMSERAVNWRANRAAALHKDLADYMIFFGIRRKMPALLSFAAAFERAHRIENPDPVRDARKIKQREQRAAKVRAELQGIFDAYCTEVHAYNALVAAARKTLPEDPATTWRATGKWPHQTIDTPRPDLPWKQSRKIWQYFEMPNVETLYMPRDTGILLRINGEQIETSQGARIPVEHAPRIWRLVQAVMSAGRPYERNGHTEHAGSYPINKVDTDGTLRAGCHVIPYAELAMLAKQLNLS